jgi:predicted nucleotidyltransferase
MSVFSNQLFISPERPVDPFTLSILELIDRLLRDAKIRYMLVGATARDLLLYHVFGHAVTRAISGFTDKGTECPAALLLANWRIIGNDH